MSPGQQISYTINCVYSIGIPIPKQAHKGWEQGYIAWCMLTNSQHTFAILVFLKIALTGGREGEKGTSFGVHN